MPPPPPPPPPPPGLGPPKLGKAEEQVLEIYLLKSLILWFFVCEFLFACITRAAGGHSALFIPQLQDRYIKDEEIF